MTCHPLNHQHAPSVWTAGPGSCVFLSSVTLAVILMMGTEGLTGALAADPAVARESFTAAHPQITPTLPDTLPPAAQRILEDFRNMEPEARWQEAVRRLELLEELTPDARDEVIRPAIEEMVILTFTQLRTHPGTDLHQQLEWRLKVFGFTARLLAVAQRLRPPIELIDGRPIGEFIRRYESEWWDAAGCPIPLKGTALDDLGWIRDKELLAEAKKLKSIRDFADGMVWIDRSFRRMVTTNSSTLESSIRNLSDTRGISRLEFYQTRLAMLELVIEHHPDEELVKRLFPTGVVPPPPVMGEFEGREQIEEREATLMERLEVDSAKRETERGERLEQMIELWDQARREAAAGDQRHGGGR